MGVLLVFSLKWSSFYPELGDEILTFIIISSCIALFAGISLKKYSRFKDIPKDRNNFKYFLFIVAGNILEYIYCRSIPILTVVFGGSGNYRDFEGVPMFHVLLVGISLFFGVYVFHQYQSNPKDKVLFRYVLFSYLPFIIGLNRGAIVLILFPCVFLYLLKIGRLSVKKILIGISCFLIFLFLFGMVGNLRDEESQENKNYILRVGGATDEFVNSGIPNEFYWGYLYIASPLGNLQNVVHNSQPRPSFFNALTLWMDQCTPDFISKRLQYVLPRTNYDVEDYFVTPVLNAPTVFYSPYLLMGWSGIIIMFFFMFLVVIGYLFLVSQESVYFLTGWCFLLSIIILNTFNNMWVFNGLYLIFIVIILSFIKRMRLKKLV